MRGLAVVGVQKSNQFAGQKYVEIYPEALEARCYEADCGKDFRGPSFSSNIRT